VKGTLARKTLPAAAASHDTDLTHCAAVVYKSCRHPWFCGNESRFAAFSLM
jgi:hypothetical protein